MCLGTPFFFMSIEKDPIWWKDDKSLSWSPRLCWLKFYLSFKLLVFFLPFHVANQLECLSSLPYILILEGICIFSPQCLDFLGSNNLGLKSSRPHWRPTRMESTCFTLIRSNPSLEGAGRHFVPVARRETPRQLPPRKHQRLSRFVRIQNHITSAPFCVIHGSLRAPAAREHPSID